MWPQSPGHGLAQTGHSPSSSNGYCPSGSDSRTHQPRLQSQISNRATRSSSQPRGHADTTKADQLSSVQYPSIYSRIPIQKIQSIPSLFRRPLTPNTDNILSQLNFMTTSSPSKFKDVRSSGKCIRCYGPKHWASYCPRFTSPCAKPCRFCKHLYHPTKGLLNLVYRGGRNISRPRERG